jgi:hypothetical protein
METMPARPVRHRIAAVVGWLLPGRRKAPQPARHALDLPEPVVSGPRLQLSSDRPRRRANVTMRGGSDKN